MPVKSDCSVLVCNFNNNKSFMKFLVSSVHLPASSIGYRPPRCEHHFHWSWDNRPRCLLRLWHQPASAGPKGPSWGMYRYVYEVDVHVYNIHIYIYTYTQFFEMIKHIIIHSYCNYISRNHILADLSTSKHQSSKGCNLGYRWDTTLTILQSSTQDFRAALLAWQPEICLANAKVQAAMQRREKKWWLRQWGEHGDLTLFFACPKLIQVPPAIDMGGCLRMARLINPGNSSAELPVSWSRHLSAPSSQPKSQAFLCIFWYFLQTSMRYFWSTCFIASDGNSFAAKESLRMGWWDEAAVWAVSMARLESCSKTSIKSSIFTFPAAFVLKRAKLQVHYSMSSCQRS